MYRLRGAFALLLAICAIQAVSAGGAPPAAGAGQVLAGPINATLPLAGEEIRKDLKAALPADSAWTMKGWIRLDAPSDTLRQVAALVDKAGSPIVELGVAGGQMYVTAAEGRAIARLEGKAGDWRLVTLSWDGRSLHLTVADGTPVVLAMPPSRTPVALVLAPRDAVRTPFAGRVAGFTLWRGGEADAPVLDWSKPDEALIAFESGSPSWPLQTSQYVGETTPQSPLTLPVSRSSERPAVRSASVAPTASLVSAGGNDWAVGDWRFVAEPDVTVSPAELSMSGFAVKGWLRAVVPGTVLTSYVANGVYPDPAYGLNNLAIPERLGRQSYWFRTEFVLPAAKEPGPAALVFNGVNYAAEVWVNGKRLGKLEGAFIRGRFPLDPGIKPGERVAVAVRVSPPPHPGLAQEESLAAGPGQNGGAMAIDGPTFGASEGWDWIPTVRDRETGLWQGVVLEQTGPIRLGDPHVRTVLPKADNSIAELTIGVPLTNDGPVALDTTVEARLGETTLKQTVRLEPHTTTTVTFAPERYRELRIAHPALWWPNGYGQPTLHNLELMARVNGEESDRRAIRFGIREIGYELSAVDRAETLQRVSLVPDRSPGEQLLDVRHAAIRKVEGGWAVSLARGIAGSPALAAAPPTSLAPHLLIRVNGVPIAVRGGNWGMDDWLKRVSRERMEPYFRLHRDANVNTIRNWMGQSTEQAFYDLADEYGMLVLNDFWISTQDHNGEPGDSALFLDNAADTVSRFQYHPSVALWIGRNEGVPPPVLNDGLERIVREADGTRIYLPNSRMIQMANSGPWKYQPPEAYFGKLARGFSTEVGTPSFPTLATFKSMMPAADQWPVSDTWAYHDWHQGKAGDVTSFMKALEERFGAPTDLADFEKKAQLLNYESHRAIFEGMNDGLFTRNSGRLLWMTHPAWPSTLWQIYSHDYDTQASFFGFKRGTEPVHVQLNLPGMEVAVVNSLPAPIAGAQVRVRSYSLAGSLLADRTVRIDAPASATTAAHAAIDPGLFAKSPVVLTRLELADAHGRRLSDNFYWLAREAADYRAMATMKPAQVALRTRIVAGATGTQVEATISNESALPALMVRLSALDDKGTRVLPAYWSDNYVSLLPGEARTIMLETPGSDSRPATIAIDGWNVEPKSVALRSPSGAGKDH